MEILGLFFVLGAAAFLGSLGFFMASIFTRDPRVLGLELTGAMMCFIGIAAISGLTLMLVSASGAGIWLMTVGPTVVSLAISILIGRRAAAADVHGPLSGILQPCSGIISRRESPRYRHD